MCIGFETYDSKLKRNRTVVRKGQVWDVWGTKYTVLSTTQNKATVAYINDWTGGKITVDKMKYDLKIGTLVSES